MPCLPGPWRAMSRWLAARGAVCRARLCQGVSGLLLALVGQIASAQAMLAITEGLTPAQPQAAAASDPREALSQYKVDLWQTEQGLPLNTVQALLQSRDGYLWVGTAGGLARFDGVRFTAEPEPLPELAAQAVFGLMEDREGRLWIGHAKGATFVHQGRLEQAISPELIGNRRVWAFAQAPDGAVWAATEGGLVRWQDGRATLYGPAEGLPTIRLRSLAFDRDGVLWIATTGSGLVSMAQGRFTVHDPGNGFPHVHVRAVLADPAGGVWAATAGGGLVHTGGGAFRIYSVSDGLPTDHLTSLARDIRGDLWIGTWGAGVVRLRDGEFSALSTASGLANDQVWSVTGDREGSLWVGTWVGGLNRLRNRDFVVLGVPEGLSHDNTRAVVHARDGATWVSTAGGGLNRIEGRHLQRLGRSQGLPTDEVSTLHEDRAGALWIGTYTGGVARRRPDGVIDTWSVAQGLPNAEVRSILQDRSGTVWIGTRAGLARFDGERMQPVREPGAPQEGVTAILAARDGSLWFGTTGEGLLQLREGAWRRWTRDEGLVSNWILSLYEDGDGSLWIGSNGEGINRLRDGRLSAARRADGLWDDVAQVILEDATGHLWMSCDRGFFRVARAELDALAEGRLARVSSIGFGPGDALRTTTFAGGLQAAGAIDQRGWLWLPSASGLVIVDPRRLPGEGTPPPVRLESVRVGGTPTEPKAVVLPPGPVPLSIRYTAMTLRYADRVRFRYRMDGLTSDWVDAGRSREASFPALPHGNYRFRVAASTDGGRSWRELETPLAVTVEPTLWQSRGFALFAAIGAVLAVAGLVQLRTLHLRRRHAEMERLVAQRTEELRQANEHLSRLSFADALTGLANRRRFDQALEEEWRRARRSRSPLAVVIADIDGFKQYNDAMGHLAGDRTLAEVAGVFAHCAGRPGDLAARYGGEEFVVLLTDADQVAAKVVAENLRRACEALALPHPASPAGPVITLSLGVASCVPDDLRTPTDLMALADQALYRAKLGGRNRVAT